MKYNFDETIERRGTHCVKWDECPDADVIPMWVADMDFRVAPAIQQAVERRAQHPVYGYNIVEDDYYDAVISWFHRRHGWDIQKQWILYTTGVVPALSVAIKALTMPGERVIIQTPVYNCFFSSIRNNGCEALLSPLKYERQPAHYEVDWQAFEQACADEKATLFVLCNPHNPAGRVWSRDELQRMADICHRHSVRIVSDEIHCELTYDRRYVPFGTVDADAVILSSPSKSFNTAGLQMANIIVSDPAVRRRLDRAININEVCDVNPFGPLAVIAAYNESEEWLDELCRYIKGNYQALCDFFAQHLPQLTVLPLEGTYLVWVDIASLGVASDVLQQRLLTEGKVWVSSGTLYGREAGEGFLRINIACPRSQLNEALNRILHLIQSL